MVGSDWLLALHNWELKQSLDLGHFLAIFFFFYLSKKNTKQKQKEGKNKEEKKGVWLREVHLGKMKLFQTPFFVFELWAIGNNCILGEDMVVIALYMAI